MPNHRNRKFVFFGLILAFTWITGSAAAQAPAEPDAARVRATGVVRIGTGATALAVPVATVRLVHPASGQAWVSWTDDDGKFDLPGLPPGKYRIEVQQIGFETATHEVEFTSASGSIELTLKIASPVSTPAAPAEPEKPKEQVASSAPKADSAPATHSAPSPSAVPQSGSQQAGAGPGRPAQPGRGNPQQLMEAMRQRMQQGGFQQVDATGQNTVPGASAEMPTAGAADMGPLGDASSSDAFLISGTVGRGATAGGDMGAMMGMLGMMGFGGFPGPGGIASAADGGVFPGQGGGPGFGSGGPGQVMIFTGGGPGGGRGAQGPGGGRQGQGQAQGQRGQQGQGQGSGQGQGGQQGTGGQQVQTFSAGDGMGALMGMQRIMRQQANRLRIGFHNRYGHSTLDARPYSLTEPDPAKIDAYRERFGVNLGGPVALGKLYNGRDRTFFFVNYDANRDRSPVDTFATVPLPAERMGDFTARGSQLFDPNSNLTGPRTPLGSVIPAAMIDPAAAGLLAFIPVPNLPGTVQNFHLQERVPQSGDRFNVRILHTISPRFNFNASYGVNSTRNRSIQNLPELGRRMGVLGQNLTLGLVQQWTPKLTHNTSINWNRNRSDSLNRFAFQQDIAGALGITGISTDPVNFGVPLLNFTNFTDANDPIPALRRNQQFRVTDGFSITHKTHTIRGGGEVRRQQNNDRTDPTARGNFNFTGLMTSQLDAQGRPVAGTGLDFADFLLGLPQSTTVRFGSSSTYFRSWGFHAYLQDDWRVHPRFTVQAGIRYELATVPIELFDKLANLDVDPAITAVATVLPGQTAPFSGDIGRGLIRGDFNNWSPRLGIAWRPKLKRNTTVRAGYGVFYNSSIYNQLSSSMANQPPHAQAQSRQTTATSLLTLQDGFPAVAPTDVPNTIAVDPNYRVGYAQIWNLAVETQVVPSVSVELTYTGTKGTHLDLLRSPNRALPGGPLGTDLNRRIPNAPGFTYDTYGASSIYHAVQARVQKRFAKGWMLMGTYTFGKSLDNASTIGGGAQVVVQDDNNFDAERGHSTFDVRHRFNAFYIWELPFGERKRWARKGWQAAVFSNWNVNGSATVAAGTPFTARLLGNAANNSGTGNNFSERPDQVGDPNLAAGNRTALLFFNTSAFALPAAGAFGNAARNSIAGPGSVQFNMSMGKNIRFGKDDRSRMDIRWEVQNLLNTPNFSGLNTVINSTTYGRVQGARPMRSMDLSLRVNF